MSDAQRDSGYHVPEGKPWEFNESVTAAFGDMLRRSVPQYDEMRRLILAVGSPFVQRAHHVVDLGAARGDALIPFVDRFGAANHFVAVETSPPMLDALRERFKGMIEAGVVTVSDTDLRRGYPDGLATLTLAVLTLQFIPLEHRFRVVRNAFKATRPGGAMVMVEKVLGRTSELDDLLVREHLDEKRRAGYSQDEIDRKRLALEGVLVPITAEWNEKMLAWAGWEQVECFWRHLNFAAWVAVRDP